MRSEGEVRHQHRSPRSDTRVGSGEGPQRERVPLDSLTVTHSFTQQFANVIERLLFPVSKDSGLLLLRSRRRDVREAQVADLIVSGWSLSHQVKLSLAEQFADLVVTPTRRWTPPPPHPSESSFPPFHIESPRS